MHQEFTAKIYEQGINPCVDVPAEISQAFGRRGHIPVTGTLNGHPITATLVSKGGGAHRLYINGAMRKQAGVDTGDQVQIALEIDTQPRSLPVPPELAHALKQNPAARAAFNQLTPSRRKEILSYLNWLKQPDSLQRNIEKLIRQLLEPEK